MKLSENNNVDLQYKNIRYAIETILKHTYTNNKNKKRHNTHYLRQNKSPYKQKIILTTKKHIGNIRRKRVKEQSL